jgi:hypothetical protein
LSELPQAIYAFQHYGVGTVTNAGGDYWRHHYLMVLGFMTTRIIGYSLMAAWLFRCGPEIDELLVPAHLMEGSAND